MSVAEYLIGTLRHGWQLRIRRAHRCPEPCCCCPWVKLGTNRLPDEGVTWEVPQTSQSRTDAQRDILRMMLFVLRLTK